MFRIGVSYLGWKCVDSFRKHSIYVSSKVLFKSFLEMKVLKQVEHSSGSFLS